VFYSFLADVVVVVHAAFVSFVVLGLALIFVGTVLRWRWVRNFWFRAVHLAAIGLVVAQALAGVLCPLTIWENNLRLMAGEDPYPDSFIGYWAHKLVFPFEEIPASAFTPYYCVFGAVVLITLFAAPPKWPWKKGARSAPAGSDPDASGFRSCEDAGQVHRG
jgi:hypothetical protein